MLYGFSLAYLAGPVVGIPVDSVHIVELAQQLPEWAKLSAKTILAAPFAFHFWNGIRHLAWDSVKRALRFMNYLPSLTLVSCIVMSVKQVTRSGYAVLLASAVSTVYLVLM